LFSTIAIVIWHNELLASIFLLLITIYSDHETTQKFFDICSAKWTFQLLFISTPPISLHTCNFRY